MIFVSIIGSLSWSSHLIPTERRVQQCTTPPVQCIGTGLALRKKRVCTLHRQKTSAATLKNSTFLQLFFKVPPICVSLDDGDGVDGENAVESYKVFDDREELRVTCWPEEQIFKFWNVQKDFEPRNKCLQDILWNLNRPNPLLWILINIFYENCRICSKTEYRLICWLVYRISIDTIDDHTI